jgi:hypothetical protein
MSSIRCGATIRIIVSLLLRQLRQIAPIEHKRMHGLYCDDIGILDEGFGFSERSEEIAAPIFVEQDHLAIARVEQRARTPLHHEMRDGDLIALPQDHGIRGKAAFARSAHDDRRDIGGTLK